MKNPTSCSANLLRSRKSLYLAIAAASQLIASAHVMAGPEGGKIVGGQGAINQSGLNTRIDQHTERMAIDWQSFNVGANERVEFHQPGASSIAFNRILSHSGSEIHGRIESNGQIILVNPNGVFFGENSRINVGGIIASGLQINPDDFMNGEFTLSAVDGTEGKVVNAGIINAATGGSVTLTGQQVNNEGLISAKLGTVNLAAGKEAVVTFEPNGLVGIKISKAILQDELGIDSAVVNSGEINAEGGRILLTASVSQDIFSQAVNSGGVGEAKSVVMHQDGSFTLGAGADVINTGNLNVSTEVDNAGRIVAIGENVTNSGSLTADSKSGDGGSIELHSVNTTEIRDQGVVSAKSIVQGKGGDVKILGNKVGIFDHSIVSASGANGGGEILIGGDQTGANPLVRNAEFVFLDGDVSVTADGLLNGDGGRLITFASDTARIHGHLSVHGGVHGGNGGFIETSGLKGFAITSTPDISSAKGVGGKWLIDPYSLTITPAAEFNEVTNGSPYTSTGVDAYIGWNRILSALQSGNVTIQTGDAEGVDGGDIIFATDAIFGSGSNTSTLELIAHRDIRTEGFDIRAGGNNRLNLIFDAGGDIDISGDSLVNTNGGSFTATSRNFNLGDSLSTPSINTAGGSVFIDSVGDRGAVRLYGSVTTNGGSFIVGDNRRPLSFESSFNDGLLIGSIDTSSNSGYGVIDIDVVNDAVLGQLRADAAGGNPSNGSSRVSVNAGGNITLDYEFNFNNSARFDNEFFSGATQLELAAGNNITINAPIYDSSEYVSQQSFYDTLDINLIAGTAVGSAGIIDINADIYTAGGNFEAEGKVFNSADGLINTDYGKENIDNSSTTGGHITLDMSGSVTLGRLITESSRDDCGGSYCGNLNITSGGLIQGSAQLTIHGRTNLNSGAANIELTNTNNQFGEVVNIELANTVTLTAGAGLFELGESHVDVALNLTATGGIRSVGDVTVNGIATFAAGSAAIELDTSGNNFSTAIFNTSGSVSVRDVNDIALGSLRILNSLTVDAAGAISGAEEQSLRVSGLTELSAGETSNIQLNTAGSDFVNVLVTRARNVSLRDSIGAIVLGQEGRNFEFSGDLTVNASGNISQAGGPLVVSGLASLRGGNITLTHQNNDFNTIEIVSALSANIGDQNTINLGNATLTGTSANSLLINANRILQVDGSLIKNDSGGGIELRANQDITVRNINTSGRAGSESAGISGGRVLLSAPVLNIGTINTSGGDAAVTLSEDPFNGGLAGVIELISQGSGPREIVISGNLIAEGGVGVNGGIAQAQATIDVRLQDGGTIRLNDAPDFFKSDINIIGNGSNDTFHGFNLSSIWTISEENAGNVKGSYGGTVRFTGIEQIRGGDEADTFDINHSITGGIYGGGGDDTFNLNAAQLAGNLYGEAGNDSFIVKTMPLTGIQIDGGSGNADELIGPNIINQWLFSGPGQGSLNEHISFLSIESIVGGDQQDVFQGEIERFIGDRLRQISGGNSSTGDERDTVVFTDRNVILDFSNDVSEIFRGIINAEVISSDREGGGTLTANSSEGMAISWAIKDIDGIGTIDNEGQVNYGANPPIFFINFSNLNGGDGNDTFTFSGNSTITGTVDGGRGTNHVDVSAASNTNSYHIELGTTWNDATLNLLNIGRIIGNEAAPTELIITTGENIWTIGNFDNGESQPVLSGADFGNVTSNTFTFERRVEFVNVANLTGGSGADHFDFSKGNGRLTGRVDGRGGADSLTGRNIASTWTIESGNDSNLAISTDNQVYLTSFVNIETLQGGSEADIFSINTYFNGDLKGGAGNDQFNFGMSGGARSVDGEGGDADRITGRDASNIWNIASRTLSANGTTYLGGFTNINNLVGGELDDRFEIDAIFEGRINGAGGNDRFVISNTGNATLLDGGAGHDVLDLISLSNSRSVSVGFGISANTDIKIIGVEEALADSGANHTLAAEDTLNAWSITGSNEGKLNEFIFSGFANLIGGNLADVFTFENGNASITGVINGGDGIDRLNITSRGDSRVQVLEAGDSTVANSINILSIEDITAGGNSTLVASNRANTWRITDTNVGTLNPSESGGGGIEFKGFQNLRGGTGDDAFHFVGSGSMTGTVDGGAHIDGDSVDVSEALNFDVRLADLSSGSGFLNIERYVGNDTDSTLYGSDAGHVWTLLAGTNQVAIGDAQEITFTGFANLQGGIGVDTFNINEGTLTGWIKGGEGNDIFFAGGGTVEGGIFGEAGNDTLTANIVAGAVGGIKFIGGDGNADQLIITGGDANYTALHDATDDDRRLVYTDLAGNAYTVSFEAVNQVNDNAAAALLTVNGTSAADTFVLRNNHYNLAGQDIHFTNKRNLTIAASNNDHISIEGAINLVGELTLRNASVTANSSGLIAANSLRLDGTTQVGSSDNRVQTDVSNLSVTAANGGIYLQERNALNLTELSSNSFVDLRLAGNLTSSTPLIFSRDLIVNTTGGDILLNGNNQLTGNLSFTSNGLVELRNTSATNLGNIQAQNLTIDSTGSIEGTGVLAINGLAQFTTSGNIVLTNADNNFNSVRINAANGVSIQDRDLLSLVGASASGAVNLSAQNIGVNGVVDVGALTLTASDGIILGNSITTTNNLVIGAQGSVTQQSNLLSRAGSINITAGQFVMNSGTRLSTEAGGINVTTSGDANLRNIVASGDVNFDVGGSVQINDLIRSIAGNINMLSTGNVNLASDLRADKDIMLQSRNGGIQQQAQINTQQGNITLTAAGDITMGSDAVASAATGGITYTGSSIAATSFVAEAGTVTLAATRGAITDNNGDNVNVTANRLVADAITGIGSVGRFETLVSELSLSNNTGLVDLQNSRALTINRLHSNGDIVLNNLVGDVTLNNTSGTLYDRNQTDARLAGGTANGNYEIGSLTINVASGHLLASNDPGPNVANPDIVARTAVLTTPGGSLGSPERMLVIYVRDHLLIGGARSWGPLWGFDTRPTTVDNQATIQGSLSDLLASGNEQLVEVETLDEVNPAVFTSVRNYFYDDIAIMLPRDQQYYDDEEEQD